MSLIRRWSLPSLLVLIFLINPAGVAANALETYGFGSRAISMGGAYTAVADDFSAVYYNPAGLTQIDQANVGLGMTFISDHMNAADHIVVDETSQCGAIFGSADSSIDDNGGFSGGIAVRITERVALGVGMYLPSNEFLAKLETQDQREPHYIWYEKRPKRFVLLASAGVKVFEKLSIGAGADVLFGPKGKVNVNVPIGSEGSVDLSLVFRPRISFYGGVLFKPTEKMSLGVTYREKKDQGEVDINLTAEIDAQLFLVPIAGKMETMIFYGPRQVTLGWAWRPCERLQGSIDVTWLQWSKFNDATMAMAVKIGQGALQVPFVDVVNPNFDDTFLPRAGVEYRLGTWDGLSWAKSAEVRVRGGYVFIDSPVPEQKGVTNYMDSDSHVFSSGLGCALESPFGSDRTFTMNLHFQLNHMVDRNHKKDAEMMDLDGDGNFETRVMGYPGYETGGELIAGGFTMGVSF